METPPSLGKGIGKAALPRVLPLPPNVLQGREQPVEVKEVRQAVGILLPVFRLVHGGAPLTFPTFHPLPVVYLRCCRGG